MLFALPVGKAVQCKNAAEPTKLQVKKKARTKRNHEGKKILSLAEVMDELSGLCRLVVVPKISVESSDEVVMMETIRPTQQRAFKLPDVKP